MRNISVSTGMVLWTALVVGSSAFSALPVASVQLADPKDQVLRYGNGSEPKELDPASITGVPESHVVENLFEGLTSRDPVGLQPLPGVAESWQINQDATVYTFNLRKNAKWSDGKPVTAHDFVASWQRVVAPETASEYAYQMFFLKNGEEINAGKIKDPHQLGVKAKDDYTLEVTLKHPVSYFLHLTSFSTYLPTPPHVIKQFPNKEWTKEGKMVGNGPFKLSEWRLNKHIKLEPNPFYWDKEHVYLTSVYIYPTENTDTEEKSFWTGELHFTANVPLVKMTTFHEEIKKAGKAYHPFKVEPQLAVYYYNFNTTRPPFNDKRVRKAFSMALDRQLLIDKVTKRHEIPSDSLTPSGLDGYEFQGPINPTASKEIIAEAKELLKQAGFPGGKGFPKVDLLYNTNENHKKIALAVRQMWKDNLGIEVGLFNQEWKVYLDTQRKMQYDISRAGWVGDYPDPNTFLDLLVSNGGNNRTGWANPEYDRLIDAAAVTIDREKRFALFRKAESLLMEEMPVLPVYVYASSHLVSEKLKLVLGKDNIQPWKGNLTERLCLKYYALAK